MTTIPSTTLLLQLAQAVHQVDEEEGYSIFPWEELGADQQRRCELCVESMLDVLSRVAQTPEELAALLHDVRSELTIKRLGEQVAHMQSKQQAREEKQG